MGCYINPPDMTKEQWLDKFAKLLNGPPTTTEYMMIAKDGENERALPICWVDNLIFTAAGVCFDDRELADFAAPDDRPRLWYAAAIKDLRDVSPIDIYWKAEDHG